MNLSIEDLLWKQYNEGLPANKFPLLKDIKSLEDLRQCMPLSKVEKAARWYVAWTTYVQTVGNTFITELTIKDMEHLKGWNKRHKAINKAEKAYARLERLINPLFIMRPESKLDEMEVKFDPRTLI